MANGCVPLIPIENARNSGSSRFYILHMEKSSIEQQEQQEQSTSSTESRQSLIGSNYTSMARQTEKSNPSDG